MGLTAGEDLALDLVWTFMAGERLGPEPLPPELDVKMLRLRLELPQAFGHLLGKPDPAQVAQWHKSVRESMVKLGFYSGPHFKTRDSKGLMSQLRGYRLSTGTPTGRAARVFVYTDPSAALQAKPFGTVATAGGLNQATLKKCRGTGYEAQCAYAQEACTRARAPDGIAVPVTVEEGLAELWVRLRERTAGRRVTALQFFDHGEFNFQQVGADHLTEVADIPLGLAAVMDAGAAITLYGCNVMGPNVPRAKDVFSPLATHLASRLLPRGGTVTGFVDFVNLDKTNWKVLEPTDPKKQKLTLPFNPWNGQEVMRTALQVLKEMVAARLKVRYGEFEKRAEASGGVPAGLQDYPREYPSDYPA